MRQVAVLLENSTIANSAEGLSWVLDRLIVGITPVIYALRDYRAEVRSFASVASCRLDFDIVVKADGRLVSDAAFGGCVVGTGNGMCPGICMGETCVIDCSMSGSCVQPTTCPGTAPCQLAS